MRSVTVALSLVLVVALGGCGGLGGTPEPAPTPSASSSVSDDLAGMQAGFKALKIAVGDAQVIGVTYRRDRSVAYLADRSKGAVIYENDMITRSPETQLPTLGTSSRSLGVPLTPDDVMKQLTRKGACTRATEISSWAYAAGNRLLTHATCVDGPEPTVVQVDEVGAPFGTVDLTTEEGIRTVWTEMTTTLEPGEVANPYPVASAEIVVTGADGRQPGMYAVIGPYAITRLATAGKGPVVTEQPVAQRDATGLVGWSMLGHRYFARAYQEGKAACGSVDTVSLRYGDDGRRTFVATAGGCSASVAGL